jgi:hypothetical protein
MCNDGIEQLINEAHAIFASTLVYEVIDLDDQAARSLSDLDSFLR